MRQTARTLLFFFTASCVSTLMMACSSTSRATTDGGGSYELCPLPYLPDADLAAPASFGIDIAPVFQRSCTSGGPMCHGDQGSAPYLGLADSGVDAATILASIVGVTSGEDPAMDLVAPTDPARSFLMHKIDHDQCIFTADCSTSPYRAYYPTCGKDMPLQSPQLPAVTRDVIRAWIYQGAANN